MVFDRERHSGAAGPEKALTISSRQTIGGDGGEYCIIWLGPEFPGDQKNDDAQSMTFDSPALQTAMDIVGQPQVEIEFSVDKPVASVAVRLNDVWPSGEVSRITYHLENLCMRDSRETPTALGPGKRYTMKIKLDDIAWRVPKDHKIRVAINQLFSDDVAGAGTGDAHRLCRQVGAACAGAQGGRNETPVVWSPKKPRSRRS